MVVVHDAGEILMIRRTDNDRPADAEQRVSEVRWLPAAELTGCTMDRSMRIRINDYLGRKGAPVTG